MRATASYAKAAQHIAHIFGRYQAGPRFKQFVEALR